ncbi:hypothetical protein DPMN_069671 [Dreissena polymorpha]|uniref:Uncharacterized protein n=1 Tax=Dreissena polymorpha TaxID=45954 RepID=A0A9D3Z3Q1_DREPO|nr:hypothetical protein DPMN_191637 [Dreissena polymorpha]KAH3710201.1 hypothetical protein DPMN_069671 [Dreissena polymorpha]
MSVQDRQYRIDMMAHFTRTWYTHYVLSLPQHPEKMAARPRHWPPLKSLRRSNQ